MKRGNGELCKHPARSRVTDPETKITSCAKCGVELSHPVLAVGVSKFGRGPVNNSVFRANLGSTSKLRSDQRGPEPYHLEAISSVYGGHGHLGALTQTRSCPHCGKQQFVKLFNDGGLVCENETCGSLVCDKCAFSKLKTEDGEIMEGPEGNLRCSFGPMVSEDLICSKHGEVRTHVKFARTHLGDYLLRWNPSNNGNGTRLLFWGDLRSLQAWDPPEYDPNVKAAREVLREKLLTKVPPEIAHRIAQRYLKGVKKISRLPRRTLVALLDSVLESEQITIEN